MIAIIIGTRPEFIKILPLVRELKKNRIKFQLIHTGQHYSKNLSEIFLSEYKNIKVDYNLKVGSHPHSKQTALMMEKLEKILKDLKYTHVIVYGDTNTALSGALVASKMKHLKTIHIEAGLRSFEENMPEETNRIIIDHISDYLFAPTLISKRFLLKENIKKKKIFVTGNLIKDSIDIYKNLLKKNNLLSKLKIKKKDYFIVTIHRQENIENKKRLTEIIKSLNLVSEKYKKNIIFSIHPKTKKRIKELKLNINKNIIFIEPVNYKDFLYLLKNSFFVISDSGGIQEECCLLKIKLITLRTSTERQETLSIGCNLLSKVENLEMIKKIDYMVHKKPKWKNPYGLGKVSKNINGIIKKLIN